MSPMLLTKNYRDVADFLLTRLVKNGVLTERQEEGADLTINLIDVVGDFQALDMLTMDMWGGHLKFVLDDTEPKSEEEWQVRGEIAMHTPQLAALCTSRAHMTVYLQKGEEWEEVTEDFHRIISQGKLFLPMQK